MRMGVAPLELVLIFLGGQERQKGTHQFLCGGPSPNPEGVRVPNREPLENPAKGPTNARTYNLCIVEMCFLGLESDNSAAMSIPLTPSPALVR